MINDLYLDWGMDLAVSSTGDLGLASGSTRTTQRVIRRLLTNAGDYLWNLDYGGGLASFVGSPALPSQIEAVIRTQIALEPTVPALPAPTISVLPLDPGSGSIAAQVQYADSGLTASVNINVRAA